jgi:hypothetical protein
VTDVKTGDGGIRQHSISSNVIGPGIPRQPKRNGTSPIAGPVFDFLVSLDCQPNLRLGRWLWVSGFESELLAVQAGVEHHSTGDVLEYDHAFILVEAG